MTAPVYAGPIYLGPGELSIGEVGTAIDVSCMVNGARISAEKDEGDDINALCGSVFPGSVTYTAGLSGNINVDADNAAGLFALSWAEPGSQQPFTFTPSTDAGTSAAGTLIIDPLDFGADEYGAPLSSDFDFKLSGDVTYTFPTGGTAVFATGRRVRRPRIPPPSTAPAPAAEQAPAAAS
jgi:hypothetical protein